MHWMLFWQKKTMKSKLENLYSNGSLSDTALKEILRLHNTLQQEKIQLSELNLQNRVENSDPAFSGPKEEFLARASKMEDKITVIIPTHNREKMVCKCIDSVLMQSYTNLEIIVVDDCSTDHTGSIISEKYKDEDRVVYVRNEKNLGPGGNRQKAYKLSSGAFVVFVDDDDFYFEPDFYMKAVALFLEYPNLAMVCANSVIYDIESKRLLFEPVSFCGVMEKESFFLGFISKYRKPNSTFPTVFRKSALDAADFSNMWMMNDTSIYLRAACVGDVCMIKDWIGAYLVHSTNISKSLPHQFIIDNLEEKKKIYSIAVKNLKAPLKNWLYTQLMVTISYYLQSRRISVSDFASLLQWISKNGDHIKIRLFAASIMYGLLQLGKAR